MEIQLRFNSSGKVSVPTWNATLYETLCKRSKKATYEQYAMTHNTQPFSQYHQVFSMRWRQCLESKAIWNLRTSMIDTIVGTVLDRLIININIKELGQITLFRRSYSIMNVGMADFASCRYDARRMRYSSSRYISIAQSIVYITI